MTDSTTFCQSFRDKHHDYNGKISDSEPFGGIFFVRRL